MAKSLKFAVTGDVALNKALAALGGKLAMKLERKALRQVSKPVLADAKANCPVDSGDLKRSLKLRAMKRSRVRIGLQVATGRKWFSGDTYYGAFQEFGWKTGKRGSENRKQIPPKHFVTKAYEKHKPTIEQAWVAATRGLVEEAAREAKGG